MDYYEITCRFPYDREKAEILISRMTSLGFEGFIENEDGIQAYIPAGRFNRELLMQLDDPSVRSGQVNFEEKLLAEQNWNLAWESSYEPVLVNGKCFIRAPFHEPYPGIDHDIVIEPKMSFGTAHHETTRMMIEFLLAQDVMGKTVLDMGCGTGVLAILASRKGAAHVTAIDNDPWAYENSIENVQKNNVSNCNVILGDASSLGVKRFDLILANINRNILLEDIPRYAEALDTRGMLAVSGFYEADNRAVIQTALSYGLFPWKSMNKGEWSALLFRRETI